jgi:hypothetical protein
MVPFRFTFTLTTASYGAVTAGDVVDVSAFDADRYTRAGWGEIALPSGVETAPAVVESAGAVETVSASSSVTVTAATVESVGDAQTVTPTRPRRKAR